MVPGPRRKRSFARGVRADAAERLAIARDPDATAEDLANVAPGLWDDMQEVELVLTVLAHPAVPAGVVGRFATHPDLEVRLAVARHPQAMPSVLLRMTYDTDPGVRTIAERRLDDGE